MAKRFNIADFIPQSEDVSNLGTMEISLIPWDRIRVNGENFYDTSDVEDLRNSIQMHGLLDPVTVTPDAEDGYYLLISGHRRHKAWGLLREEEPEKYERIPAMIRRFESKNMAELALIMANSTARVLTPAEVGRQAERIERLLYELKEEGYTFNGRMRDQVAKACQVSASRIGRLKMIREKLAECWTKKWNRGSLPEDTAYKLAQLPTEIQERIFKVKSDAFAIGVEKTGKLMTSGNDYKCEGLTGPGCSQCTHGDAFLRHDLEDPWNPCKGKTCCLKCDRAMRDWSPCSRMCSKAKEKRSKAIEKKKAKETAERDAKQSALHTRIRESALRLVKAADASGADDEALIPTRYGRYTVKRIRGIASGDDPGYQYDNFLTTEGGLDATAAARALGCSADYVCGLTEELHPAAPEVRSDEGIAPYAEEPENEVYMAASRLIDPAWMTGDPPGDGRYLCLVDLDKGGFGDLHEQQLDLRDGVWLAYGRTIDDMFDVIAWWPLPRKWEHWMPVPGQEKEAEE